MHITDYILPLDTRPSTPAEVRARPRQAATTVAEARGAPATSLEASPASAPEASRVVCRLLVRREDVFMVKRIDPEVRARAVRMFADHVGDYRSMTAASEAIASMVGVSRATMARWVAQVEV